jgi:hypothetical protein
MLECACYCDGDSEGIFDQRDGVTSREYRTCFECDAVIWPWEPHRVGYWWNCSDCDEYDDDECYDAMADNFCPKDRDTDSDNYMCQACANACKHLLCDCWWVGTVWEKIAERNEMSLAECLGTEAGS